MRGGEWKWEEWKKTTSEMREKKQKEGKAQEGSRQAYNQIEHTEEHEWTEVYFKVHPGSSSCEMSNGGHTKGAPQEATR